MGPFAKAFVAVNRVFGWFAAIGGALMLAEGILSGLLGRSSGLGLGWQFLLGAICLTVGIVYIRAPLAREGDRRGPHARKPD